MFRPVNASTFSAKMMIGTSYIGVDSGLTGTLAVLLKADGTLALNASGDLLFNVTGFGTATGTVAVEYNNTTGTELGITAGTERVEITGLAVDLTGFVSLTGTFSFEKDAARDSTSGYASNGCAAQK